MWKLSQLHSFYQDSRQRRDALRAAAAGLANAERIPLAILLFLLLGLPLLLQPTLFIDLAALQWWARSWAPVWILVTCALYAIFYLPRVPTQIVGASVDAMEQADPDVEIVRLQKRIETICLQVLVPTDIHQQKTAVHARINHAWLDRYRRRRVRLRELDLPALWFLPRFSSSRDSSD
jgi:hypothetical protein